MENYLLPSAAAVIVLPAAAALLFALAAMAVKRANQLGADIWQTTFVVNLTAGLFYSALWFVGGPDVRWELWTQPAFIALCLFGGMIAQFVALHRGDVSVAVPVMGLKLLIVAVLSPLVVGETIPPRLWLAVILSLVGVTVLNLGGRRGSSGGFAVAVIAGLIAATCFGTFDLLMAKHGPAWGIGRILPCVFWINGLLSFTCLAGFQAPLRSLPRPALTWLALGAFLVSLQGLLFIGCLAVYGRATQANVTYSIRGLMSVLLVWTVGKYFHNQEGQMGRTALVTRLLGAACLLTAIALAVQPAKSLSLNRIGEGDRHNFPRGLGTIEPVPDDSGIRSK